MICLLCGQEFSKKEQFLNLILMKKDDNGVCLECQKTFERIGDVHCPNCCRNGFSQHVQIVKHGKNNIITSLMKRFLPTILQ